VATTKCKQLSSWLSTWPTYTITVLRVPQLGFQLKQTKGQMGWPLIRKKYLVICQQNTQCIQVCSIEYI